MNTYKTILGDTFDSISFKLFGSEFYSDIIIKENKEYVHTWIFPADITLFIPEIDKKTITIKSPWG